MAQLTLIDRGHATEVDAVVTDESIFLDADSVEAALGWEPKPEGFCRGDVCVPVSDSADVLSDQSVSLTAFADLFRRPLAVDVNERVAFLGRSATTRSTELQSLRAPDFQLPDVEGRLHALSDHLGLKVLLVAYASW